MPKVLSKAGVSLADTYDVEGSIAGVEQLSTQEVQVVHEMGATIFSERLRATIRRGTTAALAQNTEISLLLTDFPTVPWRLLGVTVHVDADRVNHCSLSFRDPIIGQEIPFWHWDSAVDRVDDVRFSDVVGGTADQLVLTPTNRPWDLPNFNPGSLANESVSDISFRGQTDGFGAGTVTAVFLMYLAFPRLGGISSTGLPVPSW